MSRTVDAQQQEFTTRSHLAPVTLVVLTTYTDRSAETVDTVFYFSDRAVVYDYGNTSTDRHFWPLLVEVGPLRTSIDHVPDPRASELLSKPLTITLSNESHQGARLINTLRNSHTLENATVEVAQILQARQPKPPVDLTALDGDEHTVLYRGAVQRVATISESEIVLQCILDLPSVAWLVADDASITDPKEVGIRLPIVYGAAKKIPCVNYDVGFATTLSAQITATTTTFTVTDTTGFKTVGTGTISGENFSWTGKAATTLTDITRGQGGTAAVQHRAGEPVVETISTAKFVVAGHELSAIDDLYAISPYNGELVRVTTAYTKNLADTLLISGETVATAEFSAADLKALVAEMSMQSAVTRDDTGTPPTFTAREQRPISASGGERSDSDASDSPDGVRDFILGTQATTSGIWPWRECKTATPVTVTFADVSPAETAGEQRIHIWMRKAGSGTPTTINIAAGPNKSSPIEATIAGAGLAAQNANPTLFTTSFFTNDVNQITIWPDSNGIDIYEMWRDIKTDGTIISVVTTDQIPTSGSDTSNQDDEAAARDDDLGTGLRINDGEWVQMNFPSIATYHEQKIRVYMDEGPSGQNPNFNVRAGTIAGPVIGWNHCRSWKAGEQSWVEFVTDVQTDSFTVEARGNKFKVMEMKRTAWEHIASGASASNVEIEGANVGAGLRMFADVSGHFSPMIFADGYVFDDDTGWSDSPSGVSVEETVATRTARTLKGLPADVESTVLNMDNDATNWSVRTGSATLSDEASIVADGSTGSLKIDRISASGTQVVVERDSLGNLDISDRVVVFSLYQDGTDTGSSLTIWLGSDTTNRWSFSLGGWSQVPQNTWTTVIIDPDATHGSVGTGLDETDFDNIQIGVGGDASTNVYIDNVRTIPRTVAMQKNDIANVDLTPMPDGTVIHRYQIYPDDTDGIATVMGLGLIPTLFWSDDAGTGIVPPTDYKRHVFTVAEIGELTSAEWNEFDLTTAYTDVGSPGADLDDVETFGLFWDWTTLHGLQVIDPFPDLTLSLEKLEVEDTASNPFDASIGAVLEKPTDVLIHWIQTIGGAVFDTVSFAAALTNLGSDKWAFDARVLGFTWPEIAARMQHASRSNLIPEETASGTVYKLSQAESDYEWPAASGSITQWRRDGFVEAGRGLPELATRYHFPYAYNAALGIDESAWTAVVVATPDQSDVSVSAATLATAEATFGRFDAEPVALPTILEEATAEEIAGYYVHEGIRLAAIFAISGIPWWEAYAVEVGDLKNVTPPWAASSVKVRVIEYVKDFGTEQIELRCVEVA